MKRFNIKAVHYAMPHDEDTPFCAVCHEEEGRPQQPESRVGVMRPAHVILRGMFAVIPEEGIVQFQLDPRINVEYQTLPNGQKALLLEIPTDSYRVGVMHEECYLRVRQRLHFLRVMGVEPWDEETLEEIWQGGEG